MCDVLVGSKADLASPEELAAFELWAKELYPPKAQVRMGCGSGCIPEAPALCRVLIILAAVGFQEPLSVNDP